MIIARRQKAMPLSARNKSIRPFEGFVFRHSVDEGFEKVVFPNPTASGRKRMKYG
jgi:hypothetical protein